MRDKSVLIVIGTPLAVVLSLSAIGHLGGRWDAAAQAPPTCGDHATQEKTRAVMFDALDSAFKDHVAGLYDVWMADPRAVQQSQSRAAAGANLGIAAYISGRRAIEQWSLKPC